MPVISSNYAAAASLYYLNNNTADEAQSTSRLASGSRIVNASDDPAGLAIGTQLAAGGTILRQDLSNLQQGQALLQTADAGLAQISRVLSRMFALAAESASAQVTDAQRSQDLDTEYQLLAQQINSIAGSTQYAGQALLLAGTTATAGPFPFNTSSVLANFYLAQQYRDAQGPLTAQQQAILQEYTSGAYGLPTGDTGTFNAASYEQNPFGPVDFLVGTSSANTIAVTFGAVNTAALGFGTDTVSYADSPDTNYGTMPNPAYNSSQPTGPGNEPTIPADFAYWQSQHPGQALMGVVNFTVISPKSNIATQSAAMLALTTVSGAIGKLTQERAQIGAYESRFQFSSQDIATNIQNTDAAASVIMDADIAGEKARLSAADVKARASVAALTQASHLPSELLKLIQAP